MIEITAPPNNRSQTKHYQVNHAGDFKLQHSLIKIKKTLKQKQNKEGICTNQLTRRIINSSTDIKNSNPQLPLSLRHLIKHIAGKQRKTQINQNTEKFQVT